MKNKAMQFIFIVSLCVTFPLFSQIPPRERMGPPPDDFIKARREKIEALRIYKMTEFLNLSEQQAMNFYPRLNAFENTIRQKHKEQIRLIKEIDKKVKEGNYNPNDVKKYCSQLANYEREMIQEKERFIESLNDILTPEQQLKYLIFEAHFREHLIRSISGEK